MRKPSLNSSHPPISLTSLKGKIHFSGQHKYISAQGTNTFKQARKYIHLTANKFFGHLQIYNSIAQAPLNDDWQFFSSFADISCTTTSQIVYTGCIYPFIFFKLRYESSTLILYKELSSTIFQSCK